jgi:uncharacterized protein
MFGDKRARKVEALMSEHFSLISDVLAELEHMIQDYLESVSRFEDESYTIHTKEHAADLVRRKIEKVMFEGAFIPVYREDYIALAELVDKVANRAEAVADFVTLNHPRIPEFLKDGLLQMAAVTRTAFVALTSGLDCLLKDIGSIGPAVTEVGRLEAEVDKIVWKETRELFDSDLDLSEKILLRQLITALGSITNVIEDVGDRLTLMAVKRRF